MTALDARLAKLDAKMRAIRDERHRLKAQIARKRKQHLSTAIDQAKLETMTTAELETAAKIVRRQFHAIPRKGRGNNQKAAECRKRARDIAQQMEQYA